MKQNFEPEKIDGDQLLTSFFDRMDEADSRAREVLEEFIRVAETLPREAPAWHELAALNETWRDTLSDSQVIRNLKALRRSRSPRKERRGRRI